MFQAALSHPELYCSELKAHFFPVFTLFGLDLSEEVKPILLRFSVVRFCPLAFSGFAWPSLSPVEAAWWMVGSACFHREPRKVF